MMKKNKLGNQGFMLLETLIVSTIILSTLVFLYIQFSNIKTNYDISFRYNTIPGLYAAKEISEFITNNDNTNLSTQVDNEVNGYVNITSGSLINGNTNLFRKLCEYFNVNTILYVPDDLTKFKDYLNNGDNVQSNISEDFKRYILNLNTNSSNKDRIIIKFNDNTYSSIILGGNN